MSGGRGHSKFYLTEVNRIEERHAKQLPPGGYTPQQIEAGYKALADTFGFYHTLQYMEEITPFTRKDILDWSVAEFKYQLRYSAWKSHTDKKYHDIINPKKNG